MRTGASVLYQRHFLGFVFFFFHRHHNLGFFLPLPFGVRLTRSFRARARGLPAHIWRAIRERGEEVAGAGNQVMLVNQVARWHHVLRHHVPTKVCGIPLSARCLGSHGSEGLAVQALWCERVGSHGSKWLAVLWRERVGRQGSKRLVVLGWRW